MQQSFVKGAWTLSLSSVCCHLHVKVCILQTDSDQVAVYIGDSKVGAASVVEEQLRAMQGKCS